MASPDEMPGDYRALLADSGPGTLAGVLRLLAPGGPDGFDMRTEEGRHRRPHPDAPGPGGPPLDGDAGRRFRVGPDDLSSTHMELADTLVYLDEEGVLTRHGGDTVPVRRYACAGRPGRRAGVGKRAFSAGQRPSQAEAAARGEHRTVRSQDLPTERAASPRRHGASGPEDRNWLAVMPLVKDRVRSPG